ncbi:hypothetical protein YPPY02_3200, partial [Yersinia pestis PY-02]
MLHSNYSSG